MAKIGDLTSLMSANMTNYQPKCTLTGRPIVDHGLYSIQLDHEMLGSDEYLAFYVKRWTPNYRQQIQDFAARRPQDTCRRIGESTQLTDVR